MKITDTTRRAVLDALEAQDRAAFEPGRDLLPLRAALRRLEALEGVGEAHRIATERIRERGALLRHPDVHRVEISSQALSPSGRYLAVGDFGGDDYDRGATLQIWEVATGRCVNVIDEFVGGIGWPGHGGTLQWSADETRLAVMYRSNNIGVVDPFGEEGGEPDVTVRLTYNGRPDPFAFSPDGLSAYAWDEDSDTFGSIVTLTTEQTRTVPVLDDEAMEELYDEEEDEYESFVLLWSAWSRDGKRVYGNKSDGRICTIDVASGELAWVVEGDEDSSQSAVWSRDETVLAFRRDGSLVIADAATGQDIATVPGQADDASSTVGLSWGTRLAVILYAGHGVDDPRVGIVDRTGRHLYDIDVAVRQQDHDLVLQTWAWAPDGDRAACLTADGRIEVWTVGGERAERLRAFDGPKGATGLLWGADDMLVALGATVLRFLHADSGEVAGDFTLLQQPTAPRPLLLDGEDLGEEVGDDVNPTFALDAETWAVAFPQGVVIAPPGRTADLSAKLAWSVDRRHAWPTHWGPLDVFPDAPTAEAHVQDEEVGEILDPFHGLPTASAESEQWPPPGSVTLDDLCRAFLEAARGSGMDRYPWTGEAIHEVALILARRGEPEGVRSMVDASPDGRRPFMAAEAAMLLASAGRPDDARSLLADHDAACQSQWAEPVWYATDWGGQARAAAGVGGAYAALGDQARADQWFQRAREALAEERGAWDHRLPIVRALLECGREDEALALFGEGTGDPGHTAGTPFLAYLLRSGRIDLAGRVLRAAKDWFSDWTVMALLRRHGQTGLLREWADRNDLSTDEPETVADEDLTRRYAEIAQIAPAKRKVPMADLLVLAAELQRLDVVSVLLPKLPMPLAGGMSSDDRPYAAFRALRIVTTGIDHETW